MLAINTDSGHDDVVRLRAPADFKAALAAAACARGVSMSELIRRELRPILEETVRPSLPARARA